MADTNRHYIIYCLSDPVIHEIKYIGQSINGIIRAHQHSVPCILRDESNKHLKYWIEKVIKKTGLRPEVDVIEEFNSSELLDDAEIFYISYFRYLGANLCNIADGGNKPPKYNWTPEKRLERSIKYKGRKGPNIGRKFGKETKDKMSIAHKGIKFPNRSKEHNINMAKAKGGGWPFKDQNGRIFYTVKEASELLGVSISSVHRYLRKENSNRDGIVLDYIKD